MGMYYWALSGLSLVICFISMNGKLNLVYWANLIISSRMILRVFDFENTRKNKPVSHPIGYASVSICMVCMIIIQWVSYKNDKIY